MWGVIRQMAIPAVLLLAGTLLAQQASAPIPEWSTYFPGNWSCSGQFANGRKIEADVSFTPDLDGKWLLYRHQDRAPGKFKALGTWGVDRISGKLVSIMEDSSGSARAFTSSGWANGTVVFESTPILDHPATRERFRYEFKTANSFRMTYETGKQDGSWQMGDFIDCQK